MQSNFNENANQQQPISLIFNHYNTKHTAIFY